MSARVLCCRIFAIKASTAEVVATLTITGALACDWEDMAVGVGPYGKSYIYIGDIGGNGRLACHTIYRILEPERLVDSALEIHGEVDYQWDEPNCETLMVDHIGTLYLIAKVGAQQTPTLYAIPSFAGRHKKVNLTNGK